MSPPRMLAGGIALTTVALLATAAPASAHDELVSSDPAADAVLDSAPTTVTLTYSDDLLDVGATVIVADAAGDDRADAAPVIDGDTVSVTLDPDLPDGGYEVRWRVVSSDGHPVSGAVPFVVGDGEPLASSGDDASDATTSEPATSSTAGSADDDGTTVQDASGTEEPDGDPVGRTVLVAAGGAIAALALLTLLTFLRRRRTAAGTDDAPTSSTTDKDLS
ncbi:copper resistance CopC family protein [Isoptericola jiangsuensis]|uniref:copper resistance CopC family protein n=1 Tax=Isoptericola jiangsuensis TaxID=548579 RepID=UPI003AABA72A